jgi:pullulanase
MRSKLGIANTYKLGDVNALNYERRLLYSGTHAYFRDWIQFRLSTFGQALRYDGPLKEGYLKFFANEGSSAVVALFNADRSVKAKQLIFAVNPNAESTVIECDAIYLNDALQIADHERFDVSGLRSALIETDGGVVRLPPFTSGLWLVS